MASVVRGVHLRSAKHEMKAFTNQRSILGSLNSLLFSNATSKVITKELQGPSTAIMRHLAVFVDPWSSADPEEDPPDEESVYQSNVPKAYSGVEGDLGKGMADDVRQHPFGGVLAGCVGHDEERGITYWEYDLTGGALYNNGQNALLSNETKNEMYRKHMSDPDNWSIEALSEEYRIRQQRVMAIIGLKEIEAQEFGDLGNEESLSPEVQAAMAPFGSRVDEAGNEIQLTEQQEKRRWSNFCDWLDVEVYSATAKRGSGERHHVSVPTYPKFEEIPLSEAGKYKDAEWDISKINRMYAQKEDRQMINEFRENFLMNLGKIGVSLEKGSRKSYTSSPPKKDLPLTVTPLGNDHEDPYIAEVDGSKRSLNEDEMLNWRRKNRWAVKRMVLHRIKEREEKAEARAMQFEGEPGAASDTQDPPPPTS